MVDQPQPSDLERLVACHHAALYRYAFRLSGTAADAEDLTQQVYLSVQARPEQLVGVENERAWLFTILRNAFLKSIRRRRPLRASDLEMSLEHIPDEIGDESPLDGEKLQAALADLPDEFKFVLLMYYFEDCSYQEIAQRLQVPLGTVMSRLSRAKSHLRSRLFAKQTACQ